jgi:drug/metabolite transporter (DMT)-like permease
MALGPMTGMSAGTAVGPVEAAGNEQIDPLGAAVLMGAALAWATGSLYSRRAALPDAPLLVTGMEMLAGGVLLMLVGTVSGEWSQLDLSAVSLRSVLAVVYHA